MTLKQWEANRWLRPHKTSRQEIAGLLDIVDRDLQDAAQKELSADWRFGIAYNAALKLCTMLLHASGYRPSHDSHHYRTIHALPLVLGPAQKKDAVSLDSCRKKRNIVYRNPLRPLLLEKGLSRQLPLLPAASTPCPGSPKTTFGSVAGEPRCIP